MFWLTRGLTFNLDEWTVVTERRGPGAPSLLEPHNEHLTLLFFAIFVPLLKLGGLDAFALMMVPLVALQLALGVLLFDIARRRVGAGVALGVAAFALLSGLAYENFLIPGQAAQMLVDRGGRRGLRAARPAAHAAQRPRAGGAHGRRALLVGPRDPDPARRSPSSSR